MTILLANAFLSPQRGPCKKLAWASCVVCQYLVCFYWSKLRIKSEYYKTHENRNSLYIQTTAKPSLGDPLCHPDRARVRALLWILLGSLGTTQSVVAVSFSVQLPGCQHRSALPGGSGCDCPCLSVRKFHAFAKRSFPIRSGEKWQLEFHVSIGTENRRENPTFLSGR